MDTAIAIAAALFTAFVWAATLIFRFGIALVLVEAEKATNQIQKLIMANNIDRAVKLCNTDKDVVFMGAAKALLVRSNRAYSLNLVYQEGLLEINKLVASKQPWRRWSHIANATVLIALAVGLTGFETEGWQLWVTRSALILLYLSWLFIAQSMGKLKQHAQEAEINLLRIRNLLYARAKYVPPEDRPREMTPEDVREWRRAMEGLETEAAEQDLSATELHDERVDPDGILPPLG